MDIIRGSRVLGRTIQGQGYIFLVLLPPWGGKNHRKLCRFREIFQDRKEKGEGKKKERKGKGKEKKKGKEGKGKEKEGKRKRKKKRKGKRKKRKRKKMVKKE